MRKVSGNRTWAVAAAAAIALTVTPVRHHPGHAQPPVTPAVDVKVVNYKQLGHTVRQHKGKVVVVDLWQIT